MLCVSDMPWVDIWEDLLDEVQEALPRECPLRKLLHEVVLNVVLPRLGSRLDQNARERVRICRRRSVSLYQFPRHSMAICGTHGGMMRGVSAWRWLSGPCPFPTGNAVSMPTCVNEVAWRVASTTTYCEPLSTI